MKKKYKTLKNSKRWKESINEKTATYEPVFDFVPMVEGDKHRYKIEIALKVYEGKKQMSVFLVMIWKQDLITN